MNPATATAATATAATAIKHYTHVKKQQTTKMQRLLIAASAVAVAGFMAPPARPASVRMDASVDSILEDIKGLTLVEASELVSKIEETFGVDASSAPVAMAVAGGAAAADEKDEFDVVLTEVPADKKIAVLKIVRTITGLGLKEAKGMVESAPVTIKEGAPKDEAADIQKQIE